MKPAGRRRPATHETLKPPSALLMAMEGRAIFEWASFALAWPLLKQAPRGDGHPVLVLPGLAAGDTSTRPLRHFLEHLGYAAYPWNQGPNFGPRDHVIKGLVDRVRALQKKHDRKVSLIGWSLGGAMANALALRMPERIRQVITLGSPLTGHPKGTNVWRVFELVSGFRHDDPRLMELVSGEASVPTTSIMSKTDGIVSWRMSLARESRIAENIEVSATHLGMGANPAVLWVIADRLAQAENRWKPFKPSRAWHNLLYRDPHRFRLADLIAP
ncbi:esterase/lipase family protein [Arenimonas sp.]|uniref:esterase/lipase family protein n=1 Tax=Arenimonas sp. TaxID=1872635 RepID=UPI0039E3EC36